MTTDDGIRASDGDREHVVGMLKDAYVAGRLTLAEFHERTSAAFASRTWGDLRNLTGDLPARLVLGPPGPASSAAGRQPGTGAASQAPEPDPPVLRPGAARLLPALPIVLVWLLAALVVRGDSAPVLVLILLVSGLKLAGSLHGRDRGGHQQPLRRGPGWPGRQDPPHGPR
jgi:hypothetical protein